MIFVSTQYCQFDGNTRDDNNGSEVCAVFIKKMYELAILCPKVFRLKAVVVLEFYLLCFNDTVDELKFDEISKRARYTVAIYIGLECFLHS